MLSSGLVTIKNDSTGLLERPTKMKEEQKIAQGEPWENLAPQKCTPFVPHPHLAKVVVPQLT